MNAKTIQSKINLLKARLDQFTESGLFTKEEIERYAKPLQEDLKELELQLAEAHVAAANDIEVINPETL